MRLITNQDIFFYKMNFFDYLFIAFCFLGYRDRLHLFYRRKMASWDLFLSEKKNTGLHPTDTSRYMRSLVQTVLMKLNKCRIFHLKSFVSFLGGATYCGWAKKDSF